MDILLGILILIFSVVFHEVSHGYAALLLGDKTAQYAGRLTLNPIKHLDPLGSVLLPLFLVLTHSPVMLAWAKPVPYNPYNLRDQKRGPAIVGAAGPAANFLVALVFAAAGFLLPIGSVVKGHLYNGFLQSLAGGIGPMHLGVGSLEIFYLVSLYIVWINIMLMAFNLVPIHPLDGSKILFAVLPYRWRGIQAFLEHYGLYLLLFFIFFFSQWLFPLVFSLFRLITAGF